MEELKHILNVMKKTKKALESRDYPEIKKLSDQIIHSALIEQDHDTVSIAVMIYSLSKLIERDDYKSYKNWQQFYSAFLKNIDNMIKALEKEDEERLHHEITSNRKLIQSLSGKLKLYIQDVFRKAQINKASKIYEHGISMETTAKILGVSVWELAEYAGSKVQSNGFTSTIPIQKRVKFAQEILK